MMACYLCKDRSMLVGYVLDGKLMCFVFCDVSS